MTSGWPPVLSSTWSKAINAFDKIIGLDLSKVLRNQLL